jgi:hypothetical protein
MKAYDQIKTNRDAIRRLQAKKQELLDQLRRGPSSPIEGMGGQDAYLRARIGAIDDAIGSLNNEISVLWDLIDLLLPGS